MVGGEKLENKDTVDTLVPETEKNGWTFFCLEKIYDKAKLDGCCFSWLAGCPCPQQHVDCGL